MSQADLAKRSGCSEGLIAQIETGRRQPGLTNAVAIARSFGVSLDAIALVHVDLAEVQQAMTPSAVA